MNIRFEDTGKNMLRIALNIYRWMFARPQLRRINEALFKMSLRGLGVLNYENDKVSGEKYLISKILPQIIAKEDPVFFDVGANIGNYSVSLFDTFPNATIHAFEPHPKNFFSLKERAPSNKLKCYNIAVGESQGKLTLYDRADCDGSSHASLYEEVITEIHKKNSVEFTVPVETLNEFCLERKITEIDFMKVDTEGNEMSVLRGAKKLIESGSIKCIHFEFNEMNIVSRTFFRDFRNILQDFDLYRLLPNGVLLLSDSPVLTELFAYQNIIAIPNNIKITL